MYAIHHSDVYRSSESTRGSIAAFEWEATWYGIKGSDTNVSLVDLVIDVEEAVSAEMVNDMFRNASENGLNGIIKYSDEPLVSIDYTTTEHSAIIDGLSTMVMDDHKIKILAWYDNEWGYSKRVTDLAKHAGSHIRQEHMEVTR